MTCRELPTSHLLVMSRHSESEDGQAPPGQEGKSMLNRGRPVAAAGSGGFRETLSVEDPILTNDAWEEFDAKTGGVC